MPAAPRTIVLTSVGTLGDLHPFIAIALALKARGHRPVLAVAEDQVARVTATGLAAVPVLPGFDAVRRRLGLSTEQVVKRAMADQRYMLEQIVLPWLSSSTYALDAVLADADALVATPFVFGAAIVTEKRGLPLVTVMLQPMAMLSAHQPPHTPDFWMMRNQPGSLGMQWNRMAYAVIHGVMRQRYGGTIDEVRALHGLKPAADRSPFDAGAQATLTIGAYSPAFGPREPDAPANSVITGFPMFDGAAAPDDALDAFLAAGPAPLVFTLGSFAVHAAGDFYAEAAQAARLLGRRAVLLTGGARDLPASDDLLVRDYVAHSRVFPRAAAIIHHGGIGTTGQALSAGKPQLVVPHMGDQRDHAHRLKRLGVARTLKARRFTAERAAKRIAKLLDADRPHLKVAKRIGMRVRKENGAEAAAAAIEAVLG